MVEADVISELWEKSLYIAFLSNKSEFIYVYIWDIVFFISNNSVFISCDSEKNSPDPKI